MLKVFCAPARYTQGLRATEQLGAEIRALGLDGPAVIVAGRSAIRLLSGTWSETFAAVEMRHVIFPFGGECTAAEIRRGCQAAREANARVVIGAGGGKVLDTARAIASDLSLPVVNCPTIASSDAPCSALSVIYAEEGAGRNTASTVANLAAALRRCNSLPPCASAPKFCDRSWRALKSAIYL